MRDYAKIEGSPIFQWKNDTSISAGATTGANWADYDPTTAKYLPFDSMTITNNSNENVFFYVNQDNYFFVPKNTIQNLSPDVLPALRSFYIKNMGSSTIEADKIFVVAQKTGITMDTAIYNFAQKFKGRSKRVV